MGSDGRFGHGVTESGQNGSKNRHQKNPAVNRTFLTRSGHHEALCHPETGAFRKIRVAPDPGWCYIFHILEQTVTPSHPHLIPFPHEWTLEQIVSGMQQRDPAAGRVFFDRFSRHVNRLVWRMLGACSEHDDVVQQVFVNAFSGIAQLRDPQRLESWLIGIAVNTVRRELRSRKYRRFFVILGLADDSLSPDLDPEKQATAYEFYRMMGQFHPEERLVFVLCMVEGMTQPEAAAACGISLSTCKRRLARACQKAAKLAHDQPILQDAMKEERP